MPNTKSAKKRLRQSDDRRERNRVYKTQLRHVLRKFREAVAAKNLDAAQDLSRQATVMLDQTAARRVIHHNKAARLKSRMSHALQTAKTAA